MAETAVSERTTPEPDGWDKKSTEGRLTEEITMEFSDGSRLRLTIEVKAGSRAFASAAGKYLEHLRRVIEESS